MAVLNFNQFLNEKALCDAVADPALADYVINELRNRKPFHFSKFTKIEIMPNRYAKVMNADLVNPAGTVVDYGANAREQVRGDIASMTIEKFPVKSKRVLTERELVDLQALRGKSLEDKIIQSLLNDVAAVKGAVNERFESYFLQALSAQGVIELNSNNNADGITLTVDFGVPASHKITAGTAWTDTTNSKPITDIREIVNNAESQGIYFDVIFMNKRTLNYLTNSNEFKNLRFQQIGLKSRSELVGIDQINEIFIGAGLPPIEIIYDVVPIQTTSGNVVYNQSWVDGAVVFGFNFMGRIALAEPPVFLNKINTIFTIRNGILYSREAKPDVNSIETIANTYGFFAFDKAERCFFLKAY